MDSRGFRSKAFIAFVFLIFFVACSNRVERPAIYDRYKGQFSLILNGPEAPIHRIIFEISSVSLTREDGSTVKLTDRTVKIDSFKLKGRQIFLVEKPILPGKYTSLRMVLKNPKVFVEGKESDLVLETEEITLKVDIDIYKNQNTTLFLQWFSDASYVEDGVFEPKFEPREVLPQVARALLFVTNEGSDNVTVINRYTGKIIAIVKVGHRPLGIATGLLRPAKRIYVANSGSNTLSIIDPYNNKVEAEVPIVYGSKPVDVAVAKVSPSREIVIVANYNTDTVSFVDPARRLELDSVKVGSGPISIVVDPPVEDIIGSPFIDPEDMGAIRDYVYNFFNVYVANKNSNEISVIKVNRTRLKVEGIFNVEVDWEPVRLYMDSRRLRVLVANYGSNRLSVINVVEVMKGNIAGAVSTIVNTGTSVVDVIADPYIDRLYLLKEFPPEVIVLRTSSAVGYPRTSGVFPVVDRLLLKGKPTDFFLDPETQTLYVVNQKERVLEVIDKTSLTLKNSIPLGNSPVRVVVFSTGL